MSDADIFAAEGRLLTSVYDLIRVTPVDSFDELVDVAADFVRRRAVGQFLQQLQHVLQTTRQSLKLLIIREMRFKI